MTIVEQMEAERIEREKRTCRREIEKYQVWAQSHKEGGSNRRRCEESIAIWTMRLLEL